jgi:hypothetical protein
LWKFVKEKGLIPAVLFDDCALPDTLNGFAPDKNSDKASVFYRAILQNLFFATLDTEMDKRGWVREEAGRYAVAVEGREIRQAAEDATDRYFYTPWSCLSQAELDRVIRGEAGIKAEHFLDVVEQNYSPGVASLMRESGSRKPNALSGYHSRPGRACSLRVPRGLLIPGAISQKDFSSARVSARFLPDDDCPYVEKDHIDVSMLSKRTLKPLPTSAETSGSLSGTISR